MRNLILSGGVAHPFAATSARLAELLAEVGISSTVTEEVDQGLRSLRNAEVDLVTVNALRWRMQVDRYAHLREEHALSLSDEARRALSEYVHGGGALLAMHTAAICFDDWPEWRGIVGGVWDWERSFHPPLGEIQVDVADEGDPLVAGIDPFRIVDEAYGFLSEEPDIKPLLVSSHSGRSHPLLWAREVGRGRVVYDALGHDERSLAHPSHREVLRRSAQWLVDRSDSQSPREGVAMPNREERT